jgi:two-component system response regulator FixJ
MPGLSGIDLVREMAAQGSPARVILITAQGDVEMAVAAIKLGAFDFIEKPFDEKRLLESIQQAADHVGKARDDACDLRQLRARASSLTSRQREVMDLAVTGLSNKHDPNNSPEYDDALPTGSIVHAGH